MLGVELAGSERVLYVYLVGPIWLQLICAAEGSLKGERDDTYVRTYVRTYEMQVSSSLARSILSEVSCVNGDLCFIEDDEQMVKNASFLLFDLLLYDYVPQILLQQ